MSGSFGDTLKIIFKSISVKKLLLFFKYFLKDPLAFLTFCRATFQTLLICQKKFGFEHVKNGKANAYRHALWNILLIKYSAKKDPYSWAQFIGNQYEEIFPNAPSDTAMDLHNNSIGNSIAKKFPNEKVSFYQNYLENSLQEAICITKNDYPARIQNHPNQLVYFKIKN